MQVVWCAICQGAAAWSLMADAESPATMFELMYLGLPDVESDTIYDNGCALLSYMLNRDPAWASNKRVFIDALHAKGHVACASSLDTGAAPYFIDETWMRAFLPRTLCVVRVACVLHTGWPQQRRVLLTRAY